jgi:hypothetical protein
MYNAPTGGIGAGVIGAGTAGSIFALGNTGWLLMAFFVLAMATVAAVTLIPRKRAAMRHVGPPTA